MGNPLRLEMLEDEIVRDFVHDDIFGRVGHRSSTLLKKNNLVNTEEFIGKFEYLLAASKFRSRGSETTTLLGLGSRLASSDMGRTWSR